MLDTALLESPPVDERTAAQVERQLKTRFTVDNSTGEVERCFVTGQLEGSWDHNVAVNVRRQRWVSRKERRNGRLRTITEKEACEPFLAVEGSVHKAIMGHNVYGGPLCPVAASRWFLGDVSRRLGVELPPADEWAYGRIDWAEVYDLGSLAACEEFMFGMTHARYPRRQPRSYPGESLMFTGQVTTWKSYIKGAEFSAHDFKRLRRCVHEPAVVEWRDTPAGLRVLEVVKQAVEWDVAGLQELANRYLRVEVEARSRKLREEKGFGGRPTVVQVTREWLEALHDEETARVLREGKSGMETVRKNGEVLERLHQVYGHINGRPDLLFGVWMQLSARGEEDVRSRIPRPTFYRYKEQLVEAGVTWHGTDVYVREAASAIPRGFSPIRSDPRRLIQEADEVRAALAPFRLAA